MGGAVLGEHRDHRAHNPFNKFGWALAWSTAELIASLGMAFSGFGSIGLLLGWLGFLMRLLLGRYELGVLHAIGVVIATVVGPYFVSDAFLAFVGDSETLFMVLLYGVPATILAIWLWPRHAPGQPTNLPAARVERFRRKPRTEPQPATAAPAPAPVPVPAPAVSTPAPAPSVSVPVLAPAIAAAPLAPIAAPAPLTPIAPPAPLIAPAAPKSVIAPPAEPTRADGEPSFLR